MLRHRSTTLRVEGLESRLTPADVAVVYAEMLTLTSVRFTYQTTDDPGPFTVRVHRSADPNFDASDPLWGTTVITAPSAPGGSTATITLSGQLPLNPARPYVLVVADPANAIPETNEGNNVSLFRKLALGVVTHGFQPGGVIASWVDAMTVALEAKGYAETIAYDWASDSLQQVSGMTVKHGTLMAEQIRQTADAIGTLPNDVVDLHLIGHSRGAVVISQAALSLNANPGPRELQVGYLKMTLLDPHPARNRGSLFAGLLELSNGTGRSTIGGFSFDPGNALAMTTAVAQLQFQAAVNDPRVVIPANVDLAESYYQRLAWYQTTTPFEQELRFNIWGDLPQEIVNLSAGPLLATNLAAVSGATTVGHTAVQFWYLGTLLA
jgi:pimeloyl-ACP methyl ester carboxylesterase